MLVLIFILILVCLYVFCSSRDNYNNIYENAAINMHNYANGIAYDLQHPFDKNFIKNSPNPYQQNDNISSKNNNIKEKNYINSNFNNQNPFDDDYIPKNYAQGIAYDLQNQF